MDSKAFFKAHQIDIEESIKDSKIKQLEAELSKEKKRRLELEFKLEEASQEIASLQQCDCIERGAE